MHTTEGNGAKDVFRWARVPQVNQRTLAVLWPDGTMVVLPDCITAREAAEILECSVRCVQDMCDRGVFVEGRDWRKLCARGARGEYRISRQAVLMKRLGE